MVLKIRHIRRVLPQDAVDDVREKVQFHDRMGVRSKDRFDHARRGKSDMTSNTGAASYGNGADASEAVDNFQQGVASILKMVADRTVKPDGSLVNPAAVVSALRSDEHRDILLREFTLALTPGEVNPLIWERWLQGGEAPFSKPTLTSPRVGSMGIKRGVERVSAAVVKARSVVSAAEDSVAEASAKLDKAKQELCNAEAKEAAFMQYLVSEHLVSLIEPIFALGPAWTLMRASSAHVDMEALDEEMALIKKPEQRQAFVERRIAERKASSAEILQSLDYWCGDADYESEVHEALLQIARRYKGVERSEGRMRGPVAFAKSVSNLSAKMDAAEVLAGLSPAQP